ncbi:MAG TPA: carbamoyltransferase HypF, partial [Dehalococcoidales bacterium]|nr:carbamoyltransferase HypF [Dehalococcoidales bacterium]
ACPECGPRLELLDAEGKSFFCRDVLKKAASLLISGKIIAIKGIGGYLLACDATNESSVARLRKRKKRPAKPLAVMMESFAEIKKHCSVNPAESDLLKSPGSPIVLLRWKKASTIAKAVAPGIDHLGVMLPYSPLHHLLMREAGRPLVMTSGNISEEPIAKDNSEALLKLRDIADYFLTHNRDIYARYDDSVMTVQNNASRFIRRARGFAPHPIRLKNNAPQILACGAEEKNTFCLTRDNYAFISQHIGEMENPDTLEHFGNTIDLYKKLFRINPAKIACDTHPEYLPTRYAAEVAQRENLPLVKVQHHHAHIASCMAENLVTGPVIGVALDGTGYGEDGRIWGGEFLIADTKSFKRAAHLEYMPLPGGALAIKKPYRIAAGYLAALGIEPEQKIPLDGYLNLKEAAVLKRQIEKGVNAPLTSSMGRLFDAVAALIGIRGEIQYEAQAAIELEVLARRAIKESGAYPFDLVQGTGVSIVKIRDLLSAIIEDLHRGMVKARIAAKFHNTIAKMVVETCQNISGDTGIKEVAISGGVFQNRILFDKSIGMLESAGFKVYTHHQVPCNDGGLSLGQAVIAANQEGKDG